MPAFDVGVRHVAARSFCLVSLTGSLDSYRNDSPVEVDPETLLHTFSSCLYNTWSGIWYGVYIRMIAIV